MRPGTVLKPLIPTMCIAPLFVGLVQSKISQIFPNPELLTITGYATKTALSSLIYSASYWVMNRREVTEEGRRYVHDFQSFVASSPAVIIGSVGTYITVSELLYRTTAFNPFLVGLYSSASSSLVAAGVMATTVPKAYQIFQRRREKKSIDTNF